MNLSGKNSPSDPKIKITIIAIIEEFFRTNPTILLYICDTADNQQAMRSRLFLHWFYESEISEQFIIRTAEVNDEDVTNYITLIAQRIHPHINTIIRQFDKEIKSFKEKPSN